MNVTRLSAEILLGKRRYPPQVSVNETVALAMAVRDGALLLDIVEKLIKQIEDVADVEYIRPDQRGELLSTTLMLGEIAAHMRLPDPDKKDQRHG